MGMIIDERSLRQQIGSGSLATRQQESRRIRKGWKKKHFNESKN